MICNIEFSWSAFKHNVHEEDIRWAFLHPCYDGPLEELEDKFVRLGFDRSGNLLEIMYNEEDEYTVNIFHAMRCRSIYYHLMTHGGYHA